MDLSMKQHTLLRRSLCALLLTGLLLFPGVGSFAGEAPENPFVHTEGTGFVLQGEPYVIRVWR